VARLRQPWVAPVLLALITAGLTVWLWRWALFNHSWGNDEELYRHFAGGVARDFGLLFHMDPSYGRGIQRLHLFVMAVPLALFDNPTAFVIAHFLFVAIYASAAIPAWLIARGCGLGPLAALVPAVLVVVTPWAVVTTSFLAEPVGYGVFAWALWAMWRAATRPSPIADAIAVALLALAVVARTGFLLLLPLLPVLAVLQAWRFDTGAGTPAQKLRRLPLAALRRQPLSIGLGVAGGLYLVGLWTGVLPGGTGRFTGTYATALPPLSLMLSKWRSFLSRVDAGTGFLMLAVALPWVVARIARPREPALHALAWIGLLASFLVLLSLVGGPADERYTMFLGFTVPLVASVALIRRQLGPVMALAGGAVAFWLFFSPGWHLQPLNDFNYFSFPIEAFMGRIVLAKLHEAPAAILLAAGLIALAALAALPRGRRWLPLALVPAALFQLAASTYAEKNHVNSVGARFGPGMHARSWVDEHVPSGEEVGLLAVSQGLTGDYNPIWREIQYWNRSVRSVVKISSPVTEFPSADVPYPFGTHAISAPIDLATGHVSADPNFPFPRYLVVPQPPLSVVLDSTKISQASYIPATLVEVRRPLQARSTLSGPTPTGDVKRGTPVDITVYRAARPSVRCLFVDLLPYMKTPDLAKGLGFTAEHGGTRVARGSIGATGLKRVYLPVAFRGEAEKYTVNLHGQVDPTTGNLPVRVANYETLPTACPE
jgi:hypothetical protein